MYNQHSKVRREPIMVMVMNPLKALKLDQVYKRICGEENAPGKLAQKIKPFLKERTAQAAKEWKVAKEKMKDIPGTNYNLGLYHLQNGNLDDAIMRFKMVIFLTPEKAEAYYNLARCLIRIKDNPSAEENLNKALSMKGDFPEAKYMMDKLKTPESIDVMPDNVIAERLEWQGEYSDEELEARSQRDKAIVYSALLNITDKNPNLEVLDLGCFEGGRGVILKTKEVAKKIVGVDLSDKSAQMAKEQKINDDSVYNSVTASEISKYLSDNQEKYDLVLAGDVFFHKGRLDDVFVNIANALKPDGMLAMIINKEVSEHTGYKLDVAQDIFIHSIEYLEENIKKAGLDIADKKEKQVEGHKFDIFIIKKIAIHSY